MNKIYQAIADLRSDFKTMSFAFTKDENEIDNAVQELMLYFMQMNQSTLTSIYEKDGSLGLKRYGAVALRRSFTSPRSKFYYTYNKYYKNIDELTSNATYYTNEYNSHKSIYNLPNQVLEVSKYEQLEKIDLVLDSLDYWYDREIFKLYYYEGNTLDSLAKKTGISRNSLFTTIDKVRTKIKEEVECVFVPNEVYEDRIAICKGCVYYKSLLGNCSICKCFMKVKARIAPMACPQKYWDKTTEVETPDTLPQEIVDEILDMWKDLKTGRAKDQAAKKRMIETYNTIYNTNYNVRTNCGSCISTCFDGIKKLYNEYAKG